MSRILVMTDADEWGGISSIGCVPPLDPAKWIQDRADMHLAVLDAHDVMRARCSLWWSDVPSLPGAKLGVIGHYRAADGATAEGLLDHACRQLRRQRCDLAVGPMDGNTWNSYRFITNRGTAAPFFLEPDNPDDYPVHFLRSRFHVLARYCSSASPGAMIGDERIVRIARHLERHGIELHALDKTHPEEELRAIHQLGLVAFKDNFLYTRLTEQEFMSMYRPLLPLVPPESLQLARHRGRLVGFSFGMPDMLQARRGQRIDTLVLKTVARLPERMFVGLGSVLAERCERYAIHELGYRQIIHALMHIDNASKSVSGRFARTIREYAIYAKALSS